MEEGISTLFNILIGFCFIFFKTNLSFIEVGTVFYLTNLVGYLSIYAGIKELAAENKKLSQLNPYIIFMFFHSILFLLLNITGNSPTSIALTTPLRVVSAMMGLGLMMIGMFMILYIIYRLLEVMRHELHIISIKKIDNLFSAMLLASFLACVSFIFNFIPLLAETLMGVLLFLEVCFLFCYYHIFYKKKHGETKEIEY